MNSLFPVEIIERPLYDFQARGLEMLRQSIGGDKLLRRASNPDAAVRRARRLKSSNEL